MFVGGKILNILMIFKKKGESKFLLITCSTKTLDLRVKISFDMRVGKHKKNTKCIWQRPCYGGIWMNILNSGRPTTNTQIGFHFWNKKYQQIFNTIKTFEMQNHFPHIQQKMLNIWKNIFRTESVLLESSSELNTLISKYKYQKSLVF